MSRAEKLFDKLTAGRNDANFSFDELCTLLTKLGVHRAENERQPHNISARIEFSELAAKHRRKSQGVSSAPSTGTVAKIESQTMMKNTDAT